MVFPKEEWKELEKRVSAELGTISDKIMQAYQERLAKASFIKDFNEFQAKYPFLCINQQSTQKE